MSLRTNKNTNISRVLTYVENAVKSLGALQRSTALAMPMCRFAKLFPSDADSEMRQKVWRVFSDQETKSAMNVEIRILRPSVPRLDESCNDEVVIALHPKYTVAEKKITSFMADNIARGIVRLHELDPLSWLLNRSTMYHAIASLMVGYGVRTTSLVFPNLTDVSQSEIRDCIVRLLVEQGSTAACEQARALSIVSLDALELLSDAERWHIVIANAHTMGTLQHSQWVQWAQPLCERGIIQSVDLVGASDLAPVMPGYSTVTHLSPRPRHRILLSEMALHFFVSIVAPEYVHYQSAGDLFKLMRAFATQRTKFLVVSRLSKGAERRANESLFASYSRDVIHASLLSDLKQKVGEQLQLKNRGSNFVLFLRSTVAQHFTLQDWMTFFECCRDKVCVYLLRENDADMNRLEIENFIKQAKTGYPPRLTVD
jgi:hypothetical protein